MSRSILLPLQQSALAGIIQSMHALCAVHLSLRGMPCLPGFATALIFSARADTFCKSDPTDLGFQLDYIQHAFWLLDIVISMIEIQCKVL